MLRDQIHSFVNLEKRLLAEKVYISVTPKYVQCANGLDWTPFRFMMVS